MRQPCQRQFDFLKHMIAVMALFVLAGVPASAQVADPINNGVGLPIDEHPTYAEDIRDDYFKRFPFARDAFKRDETVVVTEQEQSEEPQGNPDEQHAEMNDPDPNSFSPEGAGMDPVKVKRSKGWPNEVATAPAVLPYVPFVKFCSDNPYQGVCYMQISTPVMNTPAAFRDLEVFDNQLTTFGYPMSDTQFQIIDRENNQRFLELLFDPERFMWLATNTGMLQGAAAANSLANGAENSFQNATKRVQQNLINVANDANAESLTRNPMNPTTIEEGVAMVQIMFHHVYVPMAVLFLLPGAVLTQVRSNVVMGFMGGGGGGDTGSPFEGILRSIIAIFLIPATQVIVSYACDIGNTMANSVEPWIDQDVITQWSVEQSYDPKPKNFENVVDPADGGVQSSAPGGGGGGLLGGGGLGGGGLGGGGGLFGGGGGGGLGGFLGSAASAAFGGLFGWAGSILDWATSWWNSFFGGGFGMGKAAEISEQDTIQEDQLWLSQMMQAAYNFTNYFFSEAVIVLTAYQLVFMCYLFLLGPIAACFWAWPQLAKNIFRNTFSNWLNAVTVLCLWRFYWCVILAVMTQRVLWLQRLGRYNPNSEFEMMVYTCFMGMLVVIPFQPFSFDPGSAADKVLSKGAQAGQAMGTGTAKAALGAAQSGGAPQSVVQDAKQHLAQHQAGESPISKVSQQVGMAGSGGTGLMRDEHGISKGDEGAIKRADQADRAMAPPGGGGGGAGGGAGGDGGGPGSGTAPPISGGGGGGGAESLAAQPPPMEAAGSSGEAHVGLKPGDMGGETQAIAREGMPQDQIQAAMQSMPDISSMLASAGMGAVASAAGGSGGGEGGGGGGGTPAASPPPVDTGGGGGAGGGAGADLGTPPLADTGGGGGQIDDGPPLDSEPDAGSGGPPSSSPPPPDAPPGGGGPPPSG